ncbi:MAG: ABC transporter permease [Clostridia bacterium]|nr:ABC transporter permease [Clostridia bacterium]
MTGLKELVRRNSRLFFKDKGMFFTALITPIILLVLYGTFLARVYRDAFLLSVPEGLMLPEKLINGLVGGEILSSLLAVSCVTVPFCANMLMVTDRANGNINDLTMSPVKPSTLALSYYIATLRSGILVSLTAVAGCFVYLAATGWYLSVADVAFILVDTLLLVMFGTALSSCINFFLSTQGQISAVGTVISAGYGFICGAYMPISNFPEVLQKVVGFLPGTYATVLLRNHAMNGALDELGTYIPAESIKLIRDSVDCNIYFFGSRVSLLTMLLILAGSTALLMGVYLLMNILRSRTARSK